MWAFRDIPLPVSWLRPYTPILSTVIFTFFSILQVVHPVVTTATEAMTALYKNDKQVGQSPELEQSEA